MRGGGGLRERERGGGGYSCCVCGPFSLVKEDQTVILPPILERKTCGFRTRNCAINESDNYALRIGIQRGMTKKGEILCSKAQRSVLYAALCVIFRFCTISTANLFLFSTKILTKSETVSYSQRFPLQGLHSKYLHLVISIS